MKYALAPRAVLVCCFLALGAFFLRDAASAFPPAQIAASSKDAGAYAALAKVPRKAQARRNPLENDPEALAAGGKLFEQHCSACHGKKGEGGNRGASLLKPPVTQATSGTLFWILSNGVVWGGMPDWSKLPPAQRWQIVTFLKSFRAFNDDPGTSRLKEK
jgi:mono/diheme cytochrome c family protein